MNYLFFISLPALAQSPTTLKYSFKDGWVISLTPIPVAHLVPNTGTKKVKEGREESR